MLFPSLLALSLARLATPFYPNPQQELELHGIKLACGATLESESQSKCYAAGIQAVVEGKKFTAYTPEMCGLTLSAQSQATCYFQMIAVVGDPSLNADKEKCAASGSWETKAECIRDAFLRF